MRVSRKSRRQLPRSKKQQTMRNAVGTSITVTDTARMGKGVRALHDLPKDSMIIVCKTADMPRVPDTHDDTVIRMGRAFLPLKCKRGKSYGFLYYINAGGSLFPNSPAANCNLCVRTMDGVEYMLVLVTAHIRKGEQLLGAHYFAH